jgi:hypothetical protein
LAIFLGPIGLFYATVVGALVMLVITVIIGFVTFGFGLFIPYVICKARLITCYFCECLTQRNTNIFNAVMVINLRITITFNGCR